MTTGTHVHTDVTREQTLSLEAVLGHAAEIGVEAAVVRYGDGLTVSERQLVLELDQEEVLDLRETIHRLGNVDALAPDTNNNI